MTFFTNLAKWHVKNPDPDPASRTVLVFVKDVSVRINPMSLVRMICGPRCAFLRRSGKLGGKTWKTVPKWEVRVCLAFLMSFSFKTP